MGLADRCDTWYLLLGFVPCQLEESTMRTLMVPMLLAAGVLIAAGDAGAPHTRDAGTAPALDPDANRTDQAIGVRDAGSPRSDAGAPAMRAIRIAAVPFSNRSTKKEREATPWLGPLMSQALLGVLRGGDGVEAVERERVEDVIREWKRQLSDAFDAKQTVQIGNLVGATTLLVGEIAVSQGKLLGTARLITVETGTVLAQGTLDGRVTDIFPLSAKAGVAMLAALGVTIREPATIAEAEAAAEIPDATIQAYGEGLLARYRKEWQQTLRFLSNAARDAPTIPGISGDLTSTWNAVPMAGEALYRKAVDAMMSENRATLAQAEQLQRQYTTFRRACDRIRAITPEVEPVVTTEENLRVSPPQVTFDVKLKLRAPNLTRELTSIIKPYAQRIERQSSATDGETSFHGISQPFVDMLVGCAQISVEVQFEGIAPPIAARPAWFREQVDYLFLFNHCGVPTCLVVRDEAQGKFCTEGRISGAADWSSAYGAPSCTPAMYPISGVRNLKGVRARVLPWAAPPTAESVRDKAWGYYRSRIHRTLSARDLAYYDPWSIIHLPIWREYLADTVRRQWKPLP